MPPNDSDISALDLPSTVGVRSSLRHLRALLEPDERVLCAATGFLEGRSGLVLATTLRLLFVHRTEAAVDVRYDGIVSFRARAGIVTSQLSVDDGRGRADIRQVHPRPRLAALARILHDPSVAAESAPPPPVTESVTAAVVPPPRVGEPAWAPALRWGPVPEEGPDAEGASEEWRPRLDDPSAVAPVIPISSSASWVPRLAAARTGARGTGGGPGAGATPLDDASGPEPGSERRELVMATLPHMRLVERDGLRHTHGTVLVTTERVVYAEEPHGAEREWPLADVVAVASGDVDAASSSPVPLPDGVVLDIPEPATARYFTAAVRVAADLAALTVTPAASGLEARLIVG